MNKRIYSLVWNRALKQITVASELAKCHHGGSAASGSTRSALRRALLVTALLATGTASIAYAQAPQPPIATHATSTATTAVALGTEVVGAQAFDVSIAVPAQPSATTPHVATTTTAPVVAPMAVTPAIGLFPPVVPIIPRTGSAPCSANTATAASAPNSTLCGYKAVASGSGASAFGAQSSAGAVDTTAIGYQAQALGVHGTALGALSSAGGYDSTAIGAGSAANADFSVAVGVTTEARGYESTAVGTGSFANGTKSTGLGSGAVAEADNTTAIGADSLANGNNDTAIGTNARTLIFGSGAYTTNNIAAGSYSAATGGNSSAFGYKASATGANSVALGTQSAASSIYSSALGAWSIASGIESTALGMLSVASGLESTAVGTGSGASGRYSTALGVGSNASANGSTALGAYAHNEIANTVSVGNDGSRGIAFYDRIINVGDPSLPHDAVNLEYLQANALIWNGTLGAFDASQGGVAQRISNVANGTAPTDAVNLQQVEAIAGSGGGGSAGGSDANAVDYDNAGHTSVTLGGVGATAPVALTNVQAGSLTANSTDAVNGSQLYAADQDILTNTSTIATNTQSLAVELGYILNLQANALQWSAPLDAYDASHGSGTPQKISNVADGTAATDAVNFGQLEAATSGGGSDTNAVDYDTAAHSSVTFGGVGASVPVVLTNVAAGAISATSTDAVNGSELYVTNQNVASTATAVGTNTANISSLQGDVTNNTNDISTLQGDVGINTTNIANLQANAMMWNGTLSAFDASHGGVPEKISNVANGTAATDAVNLGQLQAATGGGGGGDLHYLSINAPATQHDNYANDGASGSMALAIGVSAHANQSYATAIGYDAAATGAYATALGGNTEFPTTASGKFSTALGSAAQASNDFTTAVGGYANAGGSYASAFGFKSSADAYGTAVGGKAYASESSVAMGYYANAEGNSSVALGSYAGATGDSSIAIGYNATASANNSVALGANTYDEIANTVSVGDDGSRSGTTAFYDRIINVGDPVLPHDAVNLEYLQANFTTKTAFGTLTTEFNALEQRLTAMANGQVAPATATTATVATTAAPPTAPTVGAAPVATTPAPSTAQTAAVSAPVTAKLTTAMVGKPRPANVAPAASKTTPQDADANAAVDPQVQEALQSAQTYANAPATATAPAGAAGVTASDDYVSTDQFNQFQQAVSQQFSQVHRAIDQVGAASAAWAGLAQNTSGDGDNGLGVGFGSQGGQQAIAVGYKRRLGKHASFSFGGSASDGKHSVSAGVGFNW